MPWVIDTNFNNSLFAIDAVSPFPTSGSNKILDINGTGVVYHNGFSVKNQDLLYSFTSYKSNFANGRDSFGLIARRQPNGNFYYAAAAIRRGGAAAVYQIFTYTAMTDTFTQIATSGSLPVDVPNGSPNTYQLMFRLVDNTLSILFNGSTRVSVSSSFITTAGSPGIASNLFRVDSLVCGAAIDNFTLVNRD